MYKVPEYKKVPGLWATGPDGKEVFFPSAQYSYDAELYKQLKDVYSSILYGYVIGRGPSIEDVNFFGDLVFKTTTEIKEDIDYFKNELRGTEE
jgi:hypothetical protein